MKTSSRTNLQPLPVTVINLANGQQRKRRQYPVYQRSRT